MITFQTEPWDLYLSGCQRLWEEHYEELAARKDRMRMKPDVAAYRALEASGQLDVLVAREAGTMVGYLTSVVRPHLHYADTLCAFEDAYFLTRDKRRGRTGIRLFQTWEANMKARGAQVLFVMCKVIPTLDHGRMFNWLGYTATDASYSKWIGE